MLFCDFLLYLYLLILFFLGFTQANTTERVLMILPQTFAIHNHGQLLFDSQGFLFLFWGDGGSRYDPYARSQAKDTVLGKVLRIDVDSAPDAGLPYHIPNDNPYYGDASWKHWETYAHGMRHPWRCSFDRNDNSYLFCGDVGQEDREEVDLIVKGGNYGWRKYEGSMVVGVSVTVKLSLCMRVCFFLVFPVLRNAYVYMVHSCDSTSKLTYVSIVGLPLGA